MGQKQAYAANQEGGGTPHPGFCRYGRSTRGACAVLRNGGILKFLSARDGQNEARGFGGLEPLREVAAVLKPIQARIGKLAERQLRLTGQANPGLPPQPITQGSQMRPRGAGRCTWPWADWASSSLKAGVLPSVCNSSCARAAPGARPKTGAVASRGPGLREGRNNGLPITCRCSCAAPPHRRRRALSVLGRAHAHHRAPVGLPPASVAIPPTGHRAARL